MKFHCLLPVRDEADIIGQCLDHLLGWADAVYVFDTGSVDQTWEIVQDFAGRDQRVMPLRKDPVYFTDTLVRGWLFQQARPHFKAGDWFLRVDADEFHHVPPPEFVRTRLHPGETIVFHQYYNFALREKEAKDWAAGRETLADRQRPISERRRWFTPSVYSEPRLCRYRDSMCWPPSASFPFNAGFAAVHRLPIRHYPHRDPVQLQRRCALRAAMMADEDSGKCWRRPDLHPWAGSEWRKFLRPENDPNLVYWAPGTPLPEYSFRNHLAKPAIRWAQRCAHAWLLPWLDRRREAWPDSAYPKRIPPDQVAYLRSVLAS